MSDNVDDAQMSMYDEDDVERRQNDDEDVEIEDAEVQRKKKKLRRAEQEDGGEDEDEDDERDNDDDEDEEGDEDEDDEDVGRRKKRRKTRKIGLARFIDVEAEVDDEDEEEEEDEEYSKDRDFITTEAAEGDESPRRATAHQRFDRRQQELTDADLARLADEYQQRYKQSHAAIPYNGDMNTIPQRLLMPSVEDASLWQVKCRPGKEREVVFNLMRKALDIEFTAKPMDILSAFQRDNLHGMIYVEARSAKAVKEATDGLYGVFKQPPVLVPIEEMPALLIVKKKVSIITPGTWVRIKRGKYQGDLAQVIDVSENGEEAGLKFIPRIDLTPRDEVVGPDGKKRKKGLAVNIHTRPPRRFFNFEEVAKVWDRKLITKRGNAYVFGQDTYRNGFIEKDIKTNALITEDVNPSLEEITMFAKQDGAEGAEGSIEANIDLSIIANAAKKAAITVLQPGDHVEVFEGEQSGVQGSVESITNEIATLRVEGFDLEGQKVEVPAKSVRKRFRIGDHVKVMSGKNQDETGLVVSVEDNIVTFVSDMTNKEVSVFSKDIREAAEVGASTNIVGNYELHDLVQLDAATSGVIFKTERDSFRVLDQNGQVRLVQPHQITTRRDSIRAVATDSQGHEVRPGDNMKEVEGEERAGIVIHIHQSYFCFLHNREIQENGGVFLTRSRALVSVAPKNIIKPAAPDLSKQNPSLNGALNQGGVVGSNVFRGPRDRVIGYQVTVVKGVFKSYIGIIKDTNGPMVRVELTTKNRIITIERDKLMRRLPNGELVDLDKPIRVNDSEYNGMPPPRAKAYSAGKTPNPYADGGRTPAWGAGGRTPNPNADSGRTPAWGGRSYADGGKTPAWSASSKTPNPYADGGKTPAWNAGSKTPNPYASGGSGGWGGATPGRGASGWGGATPGRGANSWGGATPARTGWGGATPARSGWGGDNDSNANSTSWGDSSFNASTPAAAPTPGFGAASAPTPGVWSAPTPGAPYAAPTPGGYGVPTPGTGGYGVATPSTWSAPTPGPYGASASAQTPGAAATPYVRGDGMPSRASQSFELDPLWLIDTQLKRAGFHVRISGAMGSSYSEHEGSKGIVLNVFEAERDSSSSAHIRLMSGKILPQVPIEYLAPDHPTSVHEQVIPLVGSRKGELLKVQSVEPNNQFVVSTSDIDRISEEPQTSLCKWSDPTTL